MLIQFTRKVAPYNRGEVAGFPVLEADRLIRLGAATPVKDVPADPSPAPTPSQSAVYPDKSIPKAPSNRQMGRKGR